MKGKQAGLVAVVAVAFLTMGCGKQEHQKLSSDTSKLEADVLRQSVATTASLVQTTPRSEQNEGLPMAADSLPPDVVASASALVADRGQVVEITAQGSMDITGIMVSDGLNKMPLAYDMDAKAWRGVYRVPLRTKADRVGLAVTATNGRGQWQRVWVFIEVGKPTAGGEVKTSVEEKTGAEQQTGTETQGVTEPAQGAGEGTEPAKEAQPIQTENGNG
jgi:hypothetical protein